MADVVRLPIRERVAVLTCPTKGEWHVILYTVGLGNELLHRTFYNPHHACDLLTILGRDGEHRVVIDPSAERWRYLMGYSRFDRMGARS